jgi:hypothetical protein
MIRLQRGLLRSGVAFAGTDTAGVTLVLGLILAFVFAAATAGAVGCAKAGVGAPSTPRAAPTGAATSGLGGIAGEVCESTGALSADVGGAVARFDGVGAETGSVVAFGLLRPFGSFILVPTNIDATPSAITAMMGRDHLRTASTAELDLA